MLLGRELFLRLVTLEVLSELKVSFKGLSRKLMSATATLTIFFQARATSSRVVQRVEVEGKGFKSKRVEGKGVESKSKEFKRFRVKESNSLQRDQRLRSTVLNSGRSSDQLKA